MPGYSLLEHKFFETLFPKEEVSLVRVPFSEQFNPYVFENREHVVVVHTPIEVGSLVAVLKDIQSRTDLKNRHLLLGIVGYGVTEQLIVTLHIPPHQAQPSVYDSKLSNPERLFSINPEENTRWAKLRSMLRTLNPFAEKSCVINLAHFESELLSTVNYHPLGTQSFFDGVSCGYHAGNNIKALTHLIEQGIEPTPDLLLEASDNPVTTSAQLLESTALNKVNMNFLAFLKEAWRNTFLPLIDENERDKYHFGHYFMGWPSQEKGSKWAYFLSLKFVTTPLTNLLTLALEFPLNVLSETFSFLKNKVISWAPTHPVTQGIRSLLLLTTLGLQTAFKGVYYLLRTITSPLVSFKAAYKVHPALGYFSALTSVLVIGAGLAAIAFFAPPIMAAIAPSMGPGAMSMLSTLAYPFIQLFSLVSVSLPMATAAMLSLITGGLLLGELHLVGRKTIYPNPNAPETKAHASDPSGDLPAGSNVSHLLKKRKGRDLSLEDDFEEVPTPNRHGTSDMLSTSFGRHQLDREKSSNDFNHVDKKATIDAPDTLKTI
ncbi:MAG: hypothetical protein ACRCXC_04715 [Legionella sp.]